MPEWTIPADEAGTRLDKFLAAPDRLGSRSRSFEAIERGKVFINTIEATTADAARRLAAGDVVRLWLDRPGSARRRAPTRAADLDIVHEDSALVVVNKPAGLLTVPLPVRADAGSVEERLEDAWRAQGKRRPFVVHRIDRDTSGLVLFAKHARAQQALKDQFRRREPERIYWAVVYGAPEPPSGTWRDYLTWDADALIQKQTSPRDPRAAEAVADYRVLETFRETSLIEVTLQTGKRNQIRLQARLRGHMLVGEQRYVYGPEHLRVVDFPRQALHARRLSFDHPDTGKRLTFDAPLPDDMAALVKRLRAS